MVFATAVWVPGFELEQTDGAVWLVGEPGRQRLTGGEITIAQAMLQAPQARTLEDHTRKVVQQLWIEYWLGRSPTATIPDYGEIGAEIDRRLRATVAPLADMPQTGAATGETLTPLLRELPLIAPVFAEQWLIILRVLERWL